MATSPAIILAAERHIAVKEPARNTILPDSIWSPSTPFRSTSVLRHWMRSICWRPKGQMVGHELQDRLVIQFAMAAVLDLDVVVFDAKIGQ